VEVVMTADPLSGRAQVLSSPEDVDAFLAAHPACALFKAGSCGRTDEALDVLRPLLGARAEIPFGLIRVVTARPASQRVTQRTGVRHESPQFLLLREGQVVFTCDNWRILPEPIAEALATHFPRADPA
jgi:bacillithiol system protein YtxJ